MDSGKQHAAPNSRLRVLVVEDEFLVSMLLEEMLADLGHEVVGPVSELGEAREIARRDPLDLAILDLNLRGSDTYPVAEALRARGIPFIFATGYGRQSLREPYEDAPMLSKPFQQSEVEKVFVDVLGAARL